VPHEVIHRAIDQVEEARRLFAHVLCVS
jgi:hypothetical protein